MAAGKNSLQAILDRKSVANTDQPAEPATAAPTIEMASTAARSTRSNRDGRKFIGGHFTPEMAKQLRLLSAEEGTTIQGLLEEALELLFIRKGKGSIQRG